MLEHCCTQPTLLKLKAVQPTYGLLYVTSNRVETQTLDTSVQRTMHLLDSQVYLFNQHTRLSWIIYIIRTNLTQSFEYTNPSALHRPDAP